MTTRVSNYGINGATLNAMIQDDKGRTGTLDIIPNTEAIEIKNDSVRSDDEITYSQPIYKKELVEKFTNETLEIIRKHYTEEILDILKWLSKNHVSNEISSATHISRLFNDIKTYFKIYNDDPFSSYLIAIYDGLSINHKWIEYNKENFNSLATNIKALSNQKLDFKKVDKYIEKLKKIDIDPLPY